MIATPHLSTSAATSKAEHSQWCQQRKGDVLFCKWTGGLIRAVKLHQEREVER
jgi:hypothetical protein